MSDEIENDRAAGDFVTALRRLTDQLGQTEHEIEATSLWRRHIAGPRCLVLEAARKCRETPHVFWDQIDRFAPGMHGANPESTTKIITWAQSLADPHLFRARLCVVEAAIDLSRNDKSAVESLKKAIAWYGEAWSVPEDLMQHTTALPLGQPGFFRRLKDRHRPWSSLFNELAVEFGWRHPGLFHAGETIAWIWSNDPAPPSEHRVETWGVMAVSDDGRAIDGRAAELTLDRIAGGCGAFSPHPLSAGHLVLRPSFQQGLLHAWHSEIAHHEPCDFDILWSAIIRFDPGAPPGTTAINGPSAEGAFCCALRAVREKVKLDRRVAISAKLQKPNSDDRRLTYVGSMAAKRLAEEFRVKEIDELLVAENQPEVADHDSLLVLLEAPRNNGPRLVPVADLDDAWKHLALPLRIARQLKSTLSFRAVRLLRENSEPTTVDEPSHEGGADGQCTESFQESRPGPAAGTDRWARKTLAEMEKGVRVVLSGGSPRDRSLALIRCERIASESEHFPVPFRIGGPATPSTSLTPLSVYLSSYGGDPTEVLDRLGLALFLELNNLQSTLPGIGTVGATKTDFVAWFHVAVSRGDILFLVDEIDRTDIKTEAVANFLKCVQPCRAIVTTGKPMLHVQEEWQDISLNPCPEQAGNPGKPIEPAPAGSAATDALHIAEAIRPKSGDTRASIGRRTQLLLLGVGICAAVWLTFSSLPKSQAMELKAWWLVDDYALSPSGREFFKHVDRPDTPKTEDELVASTLEWFAFSSDAKNQGFQIELDDVLEPLRGRPAQRKTEGGGPIGGRIFVTHLGPLPPNQEVVLKVAPTIPLERFLFVPMLLTKGKERRFLIGDIGGDRTFAPEDSDGEGVFPIAHIERDASPDDRWLLALYVYARETDADLQNLESFFQKKMRCIYPIKQDAAGVLPWRASLRSVARRTQGTRS